jgi:hypothetical protein
MSTLLRALSQPAADNRGLEAEVREGTAKARLRQEEGLVYIRTVADRLKEGCPEESLVVDGRGDLTPAQMVEQKLLNLLKGKALPVSHMQMVRSLRGRAP